MSLNSTVSIIIPCYNGGGYISKAIKSALSQTYLNIEIIVIDDGSTDNTKEEIAVFPNLIYHYQENRGVSNARNKGAELSSGKYLIFLDADDWLFSTAVEIQLKHFSENPKLAFVSGCHYKMNSIKNEIYFNRFEVRKNNFIEMLLSNYIGPPVSVMFDKEVFLKYKFDESLKYSEDYDLYLRISKKESILHHNELVAAYFIHQDSISAKRDMIMMKNSLKILENMIDHNSTKEELMAHKSGNKKWIQLYTNKIYWEKFRDKTQKKNFKEFLFLLKYNPHLFIKYMINSVFGR